MTSQTRLPEVRPLHAPASIVQEQHLNAVDRPCLRLDNRKMLAISSCGGCAACSMLRILTMQGHVCVACHADTEWVLFTNGDNMYHNRAFEEIVKAAKADAVALDFYSRYSRPTGIPCERFQVISTAVAPSYVSHS